HARPHGLAVAQRADARRRRAPAPRHRVPGDHRRALQSGRHSTGRPPRGRADLDREGGAQARGLHRRVDRATGEEHPALPGVLSSERLSGHFSVDDSARRIRNYRFAEERLTRVLGGWIALTPELVAKLLFGRHVWDCAQHADAWGRRLPALRAPAQQSEPAHDAVVAFMRLLETPAGPRPTLARLAGVCPVATPPLVPVYARPLAGANPVYEPPTRRILARCLGEERRHAAAGAIVLRRLGGDSSAQNRVADWQRRLLDALGKAGGV